MPRTFFKILNMSRYPMLSHCPSRQNLLKGIWLCSHHHKANMKHCLRLTGFISPQQDDNDDSKILLLFERFLLIFGWMCLQNQCCMWHTCHVPWGNIHILKSRTTLMWHIWAAELITTYHLFSTNPLATQWWLPINQGNGFDVMVCRPSTGTAGTYDSENGIKMFSC